VYVKGGYFKEREREKNENLKIEMAHINERNNTFLMHKDQIFRFPLSKKVPKIINKFFSNVDIYWRSDALSMHQFLIFFAFFDIGSL